MRFELSVKMKLDIIYFSKSIFLNFFPTSTSSFITPQRFITLKPYFLRRLSITIFTFSSDFLVVSICLFGLSKKDSCLQPLSLVKFARDILISLIGRLPFQSSRSNFFAASYTSFVVRFGKTHLMRLVLEI